jgi:hypothetical protein
MITLKQYTQTVPLTINFPSNTGFWIDEISSGVWQLKAISIPYQESNTKLKNQLTQIENFTIKYVSSSPYINIIDVKSIHKLPNFYYYIVSNEVFIPTGLVTLDSQLTGVDLFFSEPSFDEVFYSSDYDTTFGNINKNKTSYNFFSLEKTKSQLLPTNIDYILENYTQDPNVELSYRSLVQDTNYETSSWLNLRYDGVKNITKIEGKEPALSVYFFDGVIFPRSATTSSILQPPYDINDTTRIYYNKNKDVLNSELLLSYRTTFENNGEVNTLECFGDPCSPDIGKTLIVTYYENDTPTPVVNDTTVTFLMEFVNFDSSISYYENTLIIPQGESSGSFSYRTLFAGCGQSECEYFQDNFVKLISVQGPQQTTEGPTEQETIQRGNTFFYVDKDITKDLTNLTNVRVLSLKTKRIYLLDELGRVLEID